MARAVKSAAEIRTLIHDRIHAIEEVKEDQAEIYVPMPYWHETDDDGCNWNMNVFGNASGYEGTIAAVLAEIRAKVNLVPE